MIRHMDAEEQFLMPLLEATHPLQVAKTLREHQQIRELLAELGVAVELHTARASDILQLVELLKLHSKSEDEGLYALAENKTSGVLEHGLLERLKSTIHSAVTSRASQQGSKDQSRGSD